MVSPEEIYLKKTWNPRAIVTGVLVLLLCVMAWYRPEWDDKWDPETGIGWRLFSSLPFFLVACVWFLSRRLTVRVSRERLEAWRGPLPSPLSSKPSRAGTIPLDEIESVKQVKVHGLYSWNAIPGFWTSLPGTSLKLASAAGMYCGPHALQITRIDGRVFNVGTPEPEVLAAVIDDARPGVTLEVTDSSGSD
tara:strand:- start:128 stop:703 length:576 start_codon:yes stop_codon:yes gene_type:complete